MKPSQIIGVCAKIFTACLAVTTVVAPAAAQNFPNKPITIVVPFPAGSPTDVAARALANDIAAPLQTTVLIDNRPGASQTIAASYVSRAPADGYTLMFMNIPGVVAPSLEAKLPYKGLTDFTPLADVMSGNLLLAVAPTVPAKDLKELISLIKAKPSDFSYGSAGIGSTIHLAAELFNKELSVSTVHVPFKGTQQVVTELIAGRLTYSFVGVNAMEFVRAGKLKAMGITAAVRDPDYPELPTMSEAGLTGFQAKAYFILVGPKGMQPAVVTRINAAANQVLATPAFQTKLRSLGGITVSAPSNPQEIGTLIQKEVGRWADLVKSANIQLE